MKNTPKSLQKANLVNKTVLVRVDYNVDIVDGVILDDYKIRSTVPTIQHLLKNNCKVIILSHIGNPQGKQVDDLSLMDVRFALGRQLEKQIKFANIAACENSIKFMDFGEVLLLENLKFSPLETSKKQEDREEYMKTLVKLADLFVFEAYGMDFNLASVTALVEKLPTYMGLHLEQEVQTAQQFQKNTKGNSITAIVGNENISSDLVLVEALASGKNKVLLAGDVAKYFLLANEVSVGDFKFESSILNKVKKIQKIALKNECEIVLPVDHIGEEIKSGKQTEIKTQQVPNNTQIKDIGPKTLVSYREIIEASAFVLWQGTVGDYTNEKYNKGTEAIGEYIALSTPKDCYKVAFGKNVSHAMALLKIKPKRFNFISLDSSILASFMLDKESDILTLLSKKRV